MVRREDFGLEVLVGGVRVYFVVIRVCDLTDVSWEVVDSRAGSAQGLDVCVGRGGTYGCWLGLEEEGGVVEPGL